MIDPRLYDEIGMISDGGDSVGTTCMYAICYDDINLFSKIFNLISVNGEKECATFWRSAWHKENGINDQSRDHVFWLKIADRYFGNRSYCYYFELLKHFGRISDKFRMTPDLWLFCRNQNLLWQLSLLYLIPAMVWKKFIHWIAKLKDSMPDKYKVKTRIHKYSDDGEIFYALQDNELNLYYEDLGRIKNLKELLNARVESMEVGGWSFLEYLFAELWIITMATYSVRQTAFALYVSKKIPILTNILQWSLRNMTWKGNPLIRLLTDKKADYDISPYLTDVCGKEMNQRNQDRIEYKTSENEYKCRIYNDLIEKLKNEQKNT